MYEIMAESLPLAIGATGFESICQNIRIIIITMMYSVPLDRAFAHDGRMLDSPAPMATARLTSQLMDAITKYEPRVDVQGIEFVYADPKNQISRGTLTPKVTFKIKDGVEL